MGDKSAEQPMWIQFPDMETMEEVVREEAERRGLGRTYKGRRWVDIVDEMCLEFREEIILESDWLYIHGEYKPAAEIRRILAERKEADVEDA